MEKDDPPPQPNPDMLDDILVCQLVFCSFTVFTFSQEILSILPESIACHRMLSVLYSTSLDFENAIKVSESGLELVSRFQIDYGFPLHL